MRHPVRTTLAVRRLSLLVLALGAAWVGTYTLTSAQTPAKRALTVDDYTKWRSISGQAISGDGAWVSYDLQFTNTATTDAKPVLHLVKLGGSAPDLTVPDATGAAFSSDSQWIAYQVDPGGGRGGRGGRGGAGAAPATPAPDAPAGAPAAQTGRGRGTAAPTPRRVELRNLTSGTVQAWQDVASFTFSPTSSYLLLRRRPAAADGARGAGTGGTDSAAEAPATPAAAGVETAAPRGVDMILHSLTTGHDQLLGSVGDAAFNKSGSLLAYTVDNAVRDGNGLFVLDLATGGVSALENDAKAYNRLTWNDAGDAVAVLKGTEVDKARERANVLVVYRGVTAGQTPAAHAMLDPATATGFPADWVVSDRATLSWSDDSGRVFFGMKEQVPAPATTRANPDVTANVDVWNSADERIQSMQMIRADQDRNFTFREAFDVANTKFVKLADATMRDLDVAPDGRWAVGRDTRGYVSDYKPAAADIYRVNTSTGERTLMFKDELIGPNTFGISTDGHFFLYWKDNRYQAYDLDAGTSKGLGGPTPPPLTNTEYDHPGVKPAYGLAGYSTDGKDVVVEGRYDLWALPIDGSAARNLTSGAGTQGEIRFRYVRTEPVDAAGAPGGPGGGPGGGRGGRAGRETIDLAKPMTLAAYGQWTKKEGFYELADGKLREIVYEDASFSPPTKAAKADKFLFTRQTFVDFPDLRVSGPDFKQATKISDANPQQADYLWGHRVLFDFKDRFGHRLQGILAIPDDYKPGEKRPMLVNFYEDNSQNLNRYSAPAYLTGMGSSPIQAVTEGYLTMIPDVHYHTGASHSDQLDSVEAAVKKVIEMGYVDPKHIGINGHSYGGEGAAFIATRSRLFAAVGVGAGVVDLFTDFNVNWGWSYQVQGGTGANGDDYYLYGQGREAVSPWDNPDMYHFESALTHVPEVTQPILIMHGTADPTVGFPNGLAFYNALRYNNKNAILLAYQGEGHGLRLLGNRKDLTVRYFEFFDHYLKGAPAPKWMTEGVPFLEKDAKRDGGDVKAKK